MQKQTQKAWLFMAAIAIGVPVVAIIIIFTISYFGQNNLSRNKNFISNPRLAALIEKNASIPFRLRPRSQEHDCAVRGAFPDPACTPGAVFPNATTDQICTKGYTKAVRNVSIDLKNQVYAEYGLSYPQPSGAYEADHLIPLELGGNNDIANLFPEAAEPQPGFHEKDLVENYLNHEVCAGHLDLQAAQEQIATNWLLVYNNLTPEQVRELRAEFQL